MKIAFIGHLSEFSYSGGRYHYWAMAEALQLKGHNVTLYTTGQPEFSYDFADYGGHEKITLIKSKDLNSIEPVETYDLTIFIPYLTHDLTYFNNALKFNRMAESKIVLMNFESGNWFNEISPFKRDITLWDGYKKLLTQGGLVSSSAKLSQDYAKDFYGETYGISYAYSNPAINNFLADKAQPYQENNKSILICSRFTDKHKGGQDIVHLFCEELRDFTFKFIIGAGEFNRELWDDFFLKARKFNIRIKLLKKLDDLSKFEEIKNAEALVFPSYFEGFGYPPVEARYCKVPCIAYELAVLKEVNGEEIIYVPMGNTDMLKKTLIDTLTNKKHINYKLPIQTVESFGSELENILQKYLGN
jgi:glycosyltransferase involved in cell wall biosynthesis